MPCHMLLCMLSVSCTILYTNSIVVCVSLSRWLLLNFKREFSMEDGIRMFEVLSSQYLELSSDEALRAKHKAVALEFLAEGMKVHPVYLDSYLKVVLRQSTCGICQFLKNMASVATNWCFSFHHFLLQIVSRQSKFSVNVKP